MIDVRTLAAQNIELHLGTRCFQRRQRLQHYSEGPPHHRQTQRSHRLPDADPNGWQKQLQLELGPLHRLLRLQVHNDLRNPIIVQ